MSNWPQVELHHDPGYSGCIGCGQDNPIGLKLKFQHEDSGIKAEFVAGEEFQGWQGYLHGGIAGLLLDEVMSNAAAMSGMRCVTAKFETRLLKTILVKQKLSISARITRKTRKIIECVSAIKLPDGSVAAEGKGTHFIVDNFAHIKAGNP